MKFIFIDSEPPSAQGGGIRTYVKAAADIAARNGFRVALYSHNPEAYPGVESHAIGRRSLPLPLIRWLLYSLAYPLALLLERSYWLKKELKKKLDKKSVVEFPDFQGYGFFSLFPIPIHPSIALRLHTPAYLAGQKSSWLESWGLQYLEKYCLKHAPKLALPSENFSREKLPWLGRGDYVPNPLPPAEGNRPGLNPPINPNIQSRSFNADDRSKDEIRFLYIGRIEKRKGVYELVQAFGKLKAKNTKTTLILIGKYSKADTYWHSIQSLLDADLELGKRIQFKGEKEKAQITEIASRCTHAVFPSHWENSPYAFFEAMELGLYCLGTRTGEMGKILAETGGPCIEPQNVESLIEGMKQALFLGEGYWKVLQKQREFLTGRRQTVPPLWMDYYRFMIKQN